MFERVLGKFSYIIGILALVAGISLLMFMANTEVKDLDLWLHIGTGRYIVEHLQVPVVDVLSHTIAGKPWNNHEWLFQVLVYWIYQNWSYAGLINMQVAVVAITMLILFRLGYAREKQLASIFILVMVSLVYQTRLTIRPDLFSLLFFASYIYLMVYHLGRRFAVAAFVLLQVLWVNCHGYFFFGPFFIVVAIAGEWIKRHVPLPWGWNEAGRYGDDEFRQLMWILPAVLLACLVNPQGFYGAVYPLKVLFHLSAESKMFFQRIVELQPPMTWATVLSHKYGFYKVMILVSALSFVYNRRRIDISVFFLWVVFLAFSLVAIRNLIYFALAAYLAFCTNMLHLKFEDIFPLKWNDRLFPLLMEIFLKGMLLVWIVQFFLAVSTNGYYDFDTGTRKSQFGGVTLKNYPNKAVDFLVANQVKGNFFNDFNSGAYLIGRAHPDIKVFIDGRTEVYGMKFFRDYLDIWEEGKAHRLRQAIERYNITGVLLNSVHQPPKDNLLAEMIKNPEWVPVYFDEDAVIFLKDIEQNRSVIDQYRIDFAQWPPTKIDLVELGPVEVDPEPFVKRAFMLHGLGYDDQALAELEVARKISPKFMLIYQLRGQMFSDDDRFREAHDELRIAAMLTPDEMYVMYYLAAIYYRMGRYDLAIKQTYKNLARWPGVPEFYYLLARAFVRDGNPESAVRIFDRGYRSKPDSPAFIMAVGEAFGDAGLYEQAEKYFRLALEQDDEWMDVYVKFGEMHHKKGDVERARQVWQDGLKIDPLHDELQEHLSELGRAPVEPGAAVENGRKP